MLRYVLIAFCFATWSGSGLIFITAYQLDDTIFYKFFVFIYRSTLKMAMNLAKLRVVLFY